ncbi:unnamed protein product [Phytophthora lilii]|uniref:Unnamed protein product n=1 Tax=Phytophthora lilii TaxID=2077276 RepID=A0A9W6UDJ5_9STRA|nr:unnamed protein product [Phytophthora lilii]
MSATSLSDTLSLALKTSVEMALWLRLMAVRMYARTDVRKPGTFSAKLTSSFQKSSNRHDCSMKPVCSAAATLAFYSSQQQQQPLKISLRLQRRESVARKASHLADALRDHRGGAREERGGQRHDALDQHSGHVLGIERGRVHVVQLEQRQVGVDVHGRVLHLLGQVGLQHGHVGRLAEAAAVVHRQQLLLRGGGALRHEVHDRLLLEGRHACWFSCAPLPVDWLGGIEDAISQARDRDRRGMSCMRKKNLAHSASLFTANREVSSLIIGPSHGYTRGAGSTACCLAVVGQRAHSVPPVVFVRSMDSGDRSALLCRSQRASTVSMGKKSMLRSPAVCAPHRLRSNQDDERDESSVDSCNVTAVTQKTMQHSSSYDNSRHEAATAATPRTTAELSRSKSVVVLRRCEDLNVRTGGFQKIEEAAHRLDIRRPRLPQQRCPGDQHTSQLPNE